MNSNISGSDGDRLQKRVSKILETNLDAEPDTVEALIDLSSFFTSNTLQNRRNLRNQIEKQSIANLERFLEEVRIVKFGIDDLVKDIDNLNNAVDTMRNATLSSKALVEGLIKQVKCLEEQRDVQEVRIQIANAFIARFQLNVKEHQTLYGSGKDAAIVPEFFDVLDRVQTIISDCRKLMECGYQTAANDIMDEMNLHQEAALERLYLWTQNHCRSLDCGDIDATVIKAMVRLQDRPVLFKYVIDEYAASRRATLVRLFIEALMDSGPDGNSKSIEMQAHDPKRYIGDMFAWLHQAIPSEKENLMQLLEKCNRNDLSEEIQKALAYITDGVCRPLKVRVEVILNKEKDPIVMFAISNLLRFYQQIMRRVIQGCGLEDCLVELQKSSEEIYLKLLTSEVHQILQKPCGPSGSLELPQRDLSPPASLGRLLNLLKEILSVATVVDAAQCDHRKITAAIIDPLLKSIQESASHLPTVNMAVYLLNCLYQIQSTLTVYEYMDKHLEILQAQMEAQIDALTSEQASSLVANLQLGPIYTILQTNQPKIEVNLIKIFMRKMEAFLEMPDMLLLPQIELISSTTQRATIQKRSFNVVVAIYKQIYERVHDPANERFSNPDNILSKTPEQVAKLLT